MRQPFRSQYKVTQSYGVNKDYYKKFGLEGHEGIDLIPTGSDWTVKCLADGVVVKDEDNRGSGAYGVYVTVWHQELNKATQYCHLENNTVKVGQPVKAGEALGRMGNTGNTTGAHLHLNLFEVDDNGVRLNRNNGFLGGVDPKPFLDATDVEKADITQKELDEIRLARDENHNKYISEKEKNERLLKDLSQTEGNLSNCLTMVEKITDEDKSTTEELIKLQKQVKPLTTTVSGIRELLGLSEEDTDTLQAVKDLKESKVKYLSVSKLSFFEKLTVLFGGGGK